MTDHLRSHHIVSQQPQLHTEEEGVSVVPNGISLLTPTISSSLHHYSYNNPPAAAEMRTRNNTAAPAAAAPAPPPGHARNVSGAAPFEMARSPPNTSAKNTKHVPCKFFRQGACQAGPACPFLHSTDATIDSAPCKYFTKGNCKFGAKCALAHILPDGRRVNRPNYNQGAGGGGSHLNLGGRVNPQAFQTQDSALTNSVLSQQRMNGQDSRYPYQYAGQGQDDLMGVQTPSHQQTLDGLGLSAAENGLVTDSKYGSPADDSRLQTSPPVGALTLRDVQLPASFDSQGISHVARYGPVAASVPSQFGLDLASPPAQRAPSDALRNLRDTAFGSDVRKPTSTFGSSPPAIIEDSFGSSRFMHSQRMVPRSKALSASVPRPSTLDDWDDSFAMEEDYLPVNLHDDVLTPQEKMRRLSRTEHELSSSQRDFGGFDRIASTSATTKVGSPLASSPSRFGALFARQRQRKEEEAGVGGTSSSLQHVGSPLRESSLHFMSSPSLRPIGSRPTSGDISPFVSSPNNTTNARHHQGASSMSMISQQLHNMSLHPASTNTATPTASTRPQPPQNSASNASNARSDRLSYSPMTFATSRIDEEQSDLVFSMEEEEKESNRRNSVIWDSTYNQNHDTKHHKPQATSSSSASSTAAEETHI